MCATGHRARGSAAAGPRRSCSPAVGALCLPLRQPVGRAICLPGAPACTLGPGANASTSSLAQHTPGRALAWCPAAPHPPHQEQWGQSSFNLPWYINLPAPGVQALLRFAGLLVAAPGRWPLRQGRADGCGWLLARQAGPPVPVIEPELAGGISGDVEQPLCWPPRGDGAEGQEAAGGHRWAAVRLQRWGMPRLQGSP